MYLRHLADGAVLALGTLCLGHEFFLPTTLPVTAAFSLLHGGVGTKQDAKAGVLIELRLRQNSSLARRFPFGLQHDVCILLCRVAEGQAKQSSGGFMCRLLIGRLRVFSAPQRTW